MNLRFVEAFYWVATLQSVTQAAEKLCLTQSAMSSRIASLETELGVLLLDRSLRRVRLTAAGTRFLGHARRMLDLMREARVVDRSLAPQPTTLRLGATGSVMHAWLIPWMRGIGAELPGLAIELSVDTTAALQHQMHRGALDIAFSALPASGDGILVRSLPPQEMVFVANPDRWPRATYALAELVPAGFMTSHRGSQSHAALLDLLRQQQSPPGLVHAIASLSARARLAEDGLGIAVMHRGAAQSMLRDRRLRILSVTPSMLPMSLFASWWGDRAMQTADNVVRSALAYITSRSADGPAAGAGRLASLPADAGDPSPARLAAHS